MKKEVYGYVREEHHKRHKKTVYSIVSFLLLLQIGSFIIMGIQTSKLSAKFDSQVVHLSDEIDKSAQNQREYASNLIQVYDSMYQQNFDELTGLIAQQEENIQSELSLIKSTQNDFSGVTEDVIRSVVAVSTPSSIGSGFIINSQGYVVTNYHVVAEMEEDVQITTYDQQVLDAEFIGMDINRDLALLKIPGEYEYLTLADSDEIKVGSKVIAIGNPLGLTFTVTEGIISAVDRAGPNGLEEYVQTDVTLNPGNSGGPLINSEGKVVAINNFKIGGAEAIGFSLESNVIKSTVNTIAGQSIAE